MDKLIAKAKKFLEDNPFFNEIELSDKFGHKVRIVRITPIPTVYAYPYQWSFSTPQQ